MKRSPYRALTAGFTLIELLVVIGLLGLIIAAVLVGMNGAKRKAYDTTAQACSHDIRTAQERARTADQTFRPYAALGTLRACEAITPEGNANTDRFLYTIKHPKGNVTFTVTDTDTYRDGTARSGAVLASDPAQLILGAGGGNGSGGGSGGAVPTTEADCTAQGGVFYQTTYGNAAMPICERPVDCPAFPAYTPPSGTTRQAAFISGVGCSYATRGATVTLDFNDPGLVESLTVKEGFAGQEQTLYDGGPNTYSFTTRPSVYSGRIEVTVRAPNGCELTLAANGPLIDQGGRVAITPISRSVYRIESALNPETQQLEDAYDVNIGIIAAACV